MGIHLMPPLFEIVVKPTGELTTAVFYPDAHPETTSVDGSTAQDNWAGDWNGLVNAAGSWALDTAIYGGVAISASRTTGIFSALFRDILLFDTSIIPTDAAIEVVTLGLDGYSKQDGLGILPNIGICKSAPASNTALVAGDFDSLGSLLLSNLIGYNDWDTTDFNYFSFNADGKRAIERGGITKLGVRNWNYDVSGMDPTWVYNEDSGLYYYHADKGGDFRPKLTVTWRV